MAGRLRHDGGRESFVELPQLYLGVNNEVSGAKEPNRLGMPVVRMETFTAMEQV